MSALSAAAAAREQGDHPALIWLGEPLSWAALAALAARAGEGLDRLGVSPGDRVCLRATNRVEVVAVVLALLERGAVIVPVHPRLTPREAAELEALASPARSLGDDAIAALLDERAGARPRPRAPLASRAPFASTAHPRAASSDTSAIAAVLFTSGTTGRPRGAMLSRGALLAAARASEANLGWRPDDRWALALPVCHVGGLSIVTRCLAARRTIVLLPRFDADEVLAAVARDHVTLLSVVPTMLRALLEADRANVLARLRAVLVGGAACPRALLDECARRGVPALTTYGLTEACSQVTSQRPRDPRVVEPGSGLALPGLTVSIVRPRDLGGALEATSQCASSALDEPLGVGQVGVIRVAGPTLMRGYLGGPPLDGPFETGDLGELDDRGRLFVHARRTDLVVTGGENVYPAEVEQALVALPGVRDAVVFGVPDDRWGQLVAAAIVADAPIDEPRLALALAASLAPHKRPRRWCFVEALPLKGPGKVDRAAAARDLTPRLAPVP